MPLSWTDASFLAGFAHQAYENSIPLATRLGADWRVLAPPQIGAGGGTFENGYFKFQDGPNALHAFVAHNPNTGQLVLSIRGTDNLLDYYDYPALGTLINSLIDDLQGFLNNVYSFASAERLAGRPASLYVTGHSLGGALAEAIALDAPEQFSGGGFFGSPGSLSFPTSPALSDNFLHFSRIQDGVAAILPGYHASRTFSVDDYDFILPSFFSGGHSSYRDFYQLSLIANSPLANYLSFESNNIAFLPTSGGDSVVGAGWPGHGIDHVFFGSVAQDNVSHAGGYSPIWVDGGGGWDTISGGDGADILCGGNGDDALEGRGGDDRLFGGSGSDTYQVGFNQGYDIIDDRGGSAGDILRIHVENESLRFTQTWFQVEGNDLLVRIPKDGGGYLVDIRIKNMGTNPGQLELIQLIGLDGHTVIDDWDLVNLWDYRAQPDPIDPTGPSTPPPTPTTPSGAFEDLSDGANIRTGGSGADYWNGRGGWDRLDGGGGNDIILGGSGGVFDIAYPTGQGDELNGGAGMDVLVDDDQSGVRDADRLSGGDGDDELIFHGAGSGLFDTGDGGEGTDLAEVDLNDSSLAWIGGGTTHSQLYIRSQDGSERGVWLNSFETIALFLGSGDDQISGGDEIDYFYGNGGNDILNGEGGNDELAGGDGDDTLSGGLGIDWLDGGSGSDLAVLTISDETRNLTYSGSLAATASGFTILDGTHVRNVERANIWTGSGDDRVSDGRYDDTFYLGAGNDEARLSGGNDYVDGGTGIDHLVVNFGWATFDVVGRFDPGGGPGGYLVHQQNAFDSGNRSWSVNFETFDITGGSGNDTLNGGAGNDILIGGSGDDILYGGAGVNRLDGGSGFDRVSLTLATESINVTFDGSAAATTTGFTLVDGTHVRNTETFELVLESGDDWVSDGRYDDTFYLGAGSDEARLSGGNDYVDGGAGIDRLVVNFGWATFDVVGRFDPGGGPGGYLVHKQDDFDSGNRTWSVNFETFDITGGSGNDTLNGGAGDDTLTGGSGNDILYGGAGVNRLDGGSGIDRISLTFATESINVTFDGSAAATTTGVTLIDGSHVRNAETFELVTGSGNDWVSDGRYDDTFHLGAGNDEARLSGGNDYVDGGTGTDRLVVNFGWATFDVVGRFDPGGGPGGYLVHKQDDFDSGNRTWSVNFETFDITGGSGSDTLNGGAGNDTLTGGSGDDTLYDGAGDDTLSGGAGNDLFTGALGNDVIDGGSGHDTLAVSSVASNYRLLMDGDNSILKGPDGGDRLTGVESIRFSDGRVLELNRMYGPDVDMRAWADGRIPEALLSGGAGTGDRPLVLPGAHDPDTWVGKDGSRPEVLPEVSDGDRWVWKGDGTPLVLPGVDDDFVVNTKGFGGPEVLPGEDEWTAAGPKGFDQPEVLPGTNDLRLFSFDRAAGLLSQWSGQMLTVDEQGRVVDHHDRGGWGPESWGF